MSVYSDAVLADSPALYWRLGESAGTNANDETANNRDGTYSAGVTLAQTGLLTADAATSVSFAETATVLSTYNPFAGARTFEGWAYRNSTATFDVLFMSTGANRVQLHVVSGSGDVTFTPNEGVAGGTLTWTGAWPTTTVVHWVLTYTDAGNAELWINGVSKGTITPSSGYGASPSNFRLGRSDDFSFTGRQQEAAIYTSILSADRIVYHYQAGTNTLPAPPPALRLTAPRQAPLTVLVTHQDGYVTRLGADEPDSAWIPMGITWSTALPGGWKDASFSLRRRIDEDVPLRLLDEVVIIDGDGQTMYEGRIVKLPRQHGDDYLLGVECMGWASHLLDDPSVPYFFVDRDMGSWQAPGLNRRVASGSVPWEADYGATVDAQFIQFEGPGDAAGGRTILINSRAELMYKAPVGTTCAKAMYRGTEANTTNVDGPTIITDDNDAFSSGTGNAITLDDTLRTVTFSAAERYLLTRANASAQHTPTSPFNRRFSKLGIYANHGLTSVAISGEPDGFYIDDMLGWALARGAPKINFTTSATSTEPSIQRPPVVVPHACDNGLGTVERIVLDLNKFVIWDWVVYDNRTFFYRPPDPDRLTWEARLDQGAFLDLEGDDVERAVNGVMVSYTTFDGTAKVAGPTGSGLDYESALLMDSDTEGTVNAHGYTKKWVDYPVNFGLADDSYAAIIGAAYLAQTQLPSRSGNITVRGSAGHPTKGDRPAREIRAGDWIKISDHPADVPRRVISTTHSDDDRSTTVSVGNDLNKVDAMLEQVQLASRLAVG